MTNRRPFLVVVRVGDKSLHPGWIDGERNFDLIVDYYGDTLGRWDGTADLVLESKGSKWQGLHAVLAARPTLLTDYEAVWFPDDDIATDAETISTMFELHQQLGLGLSQPALSADSYFTHLMTLQHPGVAVRYTNFVEVMVPLFSQAALTACFPTFAESASGFGLDLVWQAIVPGLGLRSAILDCLTVRHTRPLGTGSLYDGMTEPPFVEGGRVARRHGLPAVYELRTHAVLDGSFEPVAGASIDATLAQHMPQPTQQPVPAWDAYAVDLERRITGGARVRHQPAALPVLRAASESAAVLPTPESDGRELSPTVVVVAREAAPLTAAWELAGWSTAVLDPTQVHQLPVVLELAQDARARVLDLSDLDGDDLESAALRGHAWGFDVIVRLDGPPACDHRIPDDIRYSQRTCPSCDVRWRSLSAASSIIVATSPVGDDGSHVGTPVLDRFTPPAPPRPAPPVSPLTVVVVDDGTSADERLRASLVALERQRGLTRPPEVILCSPTGARRPAPASAEVRTVSETGALALQAAAAAATTTDRVLVLNGADIAGPWLVHDHVRAGLTGVPVVLSPSRSGTGEDPLAQTLDAGPTADAGELPPLGARASLPRELLVELSRAQGLASASVVAAVASQVNGSWLLARATHTTPKIDDLSLVAADTVAAALSAAVTTPVPCTSAAAAELVQWSHIAAPAGIQLAELSGAPTALLRGTTQHYFTGDRLVDWVRATTSTFVTAHTSAAVLAATATQEAIEAVRPVLLAVDGDDPRLLEVVAGVHHRDLVASGWLRILVVLDPHTGPAPWAEAFARHLQAAGVPLDVLAHVDVRTGQLPAARLIDADLVLPDAGEPWCPGLPVPLIGTEPLEWLSRLELVALAAAVRKMSQADAPITRSAQAAVAVGR